MYLVGFTIEMYLMVLDVTLIILKRSLMPTPHVTLQSVHTLQSLTTQSTGGPTAVAEVVLSSFGRVAPCCDS